MSSPVSPIPFEISSFVLKPATAKQYLSFYSSPLIVTTAPIFYLK